MSIMVAEVYRALVEAGAPETSARAAAAAIPVAGDMVVKEDLWALKEELLTRIAQVEHGLGERIEQQGREMGERIAQQGERIAQVEHGLGERIEQQGREMGERIAQQGLETGKRIEQVEHGLGERIAQQGREMGERIGRLERDLAVLKFAYGPIIIALLLKIAFLP